MRKRFASNTMFRMAVVTILPFCWFVLLDLCYRYLYPQTDYYDWTCLTALTFTLLWSGVFTGLLILLPSVIRRIATVILAVLACIPPLINAVLYILTGTVFSFADMSFAGEGIRFLSVSYLHFRLGLIVMVAVTLVGAVITALLIPKCAYRWPQALIGVAVIAFSLCGIQLQHLRLRESDTNNLSWDTAVYDENTDTAIYTNFSDLNYVFYLTGEYQYLFRNGLITAGWEDYLENGATYEQLDEYYSAKTPHTENEWTGVFSGKNLILIQLESIDTWMLTEDYMPNLYRLKQEGVEWNDNYTPLFSAAATFNTEFIANTSLTIPPSGISTKAYVSYPLPYSLPHLFKDAGYQTNTFHPSAGTIYNRAQIHLNWGYDVYHSYLEMHMEDYMRDSEMINGYEDMVSDKPFLTFIITYSGHGPYTEDMDNISAGHWDAVYSAVDPKLIPAEGKDLEEYYRAIAHAMETDAFVGELVDHMTLDGHIQDTVLFFYDDHYAKYMTNTDFVMELKGSASYNEMMQTPCFFYYFGIEPGKLNKATSSLDILPSIANLFGLDTDYRYYLGRDVFSQDDGLVMFRNYDWYDGVSMHESGEGEQEPEVKETSKYVHQALDCAWATFKCNYFAHLIDEQSNIQ